MPGASPSTANDGDGVAPGLTPAPYVTVQLSTGTLRLAGALSVGEEATPAEDGDAPAGDRPGDRPAPDAPGLPAVQAHRQKIRPTTIHSLPGARFATDAMPQCTPK